MKANDQRPLARNTPNWFSHGVIYQIWLRSFTAEGTLAAAAKRLPQVAELGANVVYLSPVMLADTDTNQEFWSTRQKASVAANPRNPYRADDFTQVDPEYGSERDLQTFFTEAHHLGLKVLMDLVYHHTGPTSVLLSRPDFHQRDETGTPVKNNWNFLKLNLANQELREYLIKDMEHWLALGADGFRLDVSSAVPLDFWEEVRRRLSQRNADLVMVAEHEGRDSEQQTAFDASYSFGWYDKLVKVVVEGESAEMLRQHHHEMVAATPQGARFLRYSDNHDLHRSDVVFGEAAARALLILHFAMDGVPFLYNGQEIADTTPQDLFSHWPIRWETGSTFKNQSRWLLVKNLCRLRRDAQGPAQASFDWISHDNESRVLAFERISSQIRWLTAINLTNRPVTVSLPAEGPFQDLLEEGLYKPEKEKLTVRLGAFGALWLKGRMGNRQ